MSEPENASPLLAAALLSAQQQVQSAVKSSVNSFHRYKYASAEEVLSVGREALNANGLTLSIDRASFDALNTELGGAVGLLRVRYLLQHNSGEHRYIESDVPVCPEQGKTSGWSRPLDKALFAARTETLGYLLRDLLLIPREDADDVSGRGDRPDRGDQRAAAPPAEEPKRPAPPPTDTPVADFAREIREAKDRPSALAALGRARAAGQGGDPIEAAFVDRMMRDIRAADVETLESIKALLVRAELRQGSPQDEGVRLCMKQRRKEFSPV